MTKRWTMCLLLLAAWACIGSTTGCGSSTPCTYEGKTYKSGETFPSSDGCNTCSCNASGETSCTLRACIQTCGGLEEKVCTGEKVCVLQSGSCNAHAEGLCKEKQTCPDVAAPVCGCDGKTYDNSCIAEQAGVQLKSTGPCPKRSCIHEGKTLQHGESKLNNGSCEECTCDDGKLTCQPDQCTCLVDGKAIKNGEEVTLKDSCEKCVCDSGELSCHRACCLHEETYYKPGESYTTADKCELCTCQKGLKFACKGTTTCSTDCTYEGKRWTTGQTFPHKDGCNRCTCNEGTVTCTDLVECYPECGGTQGVQCGTGEICKYTFGGSCDTAGAKGHCIPVKTCSKTENEACGCDQKTYLNQCTADMAGIKVAYSGPCKTSPPCGGRGLPPCGAEEFCNQPTHCGRTDIPGKCTPIAQGCTKEYSPVCGCGGQTYANECLAHAQGVSVQYAGACK